MTTSREWHLIRRPQGVPVDEDFALVDVELPAPGDGEILVPTASSPSTPTCVAG